SNSYDIIAEAATKASDRGIKVSKQLTDEVMNAQREALSFAKKVAVDPDHFMSSSYIGLTESAVTAQSRALAFAQVAYQEALAAGSETRETAEKLAKVNRETAEAAVELSRGWSSMSPIAEMFFKGMETWQAAATGPRN